MAGWSSEEWALAQRMRQEGKTHGQIGIRVGGRSRLAVRLKFREERIREKSGGANPVGSPASEREKRIPRTLCDNPDLKLLDAVMADGGMSIPRMDRLESNGRLISEAFMGRYGPNGERRPPGWEDGMAEVDMDEAQRRHLRAVRAWWKHERVAFALSTAPDEQAA